MASTPALLLLHHISPQLLPSTSPLKRSRARTGGSYFSRTAPSKGMGAQNPKRSVRHMHNAIFERTSLFCGREK
eukprot:6698158-Pyramimonas_sp.AAC.1